MIRGAIRHRVGVAIAGLALVGVLFLAVFPTQAWLAQRRDRGQLTEQLAGLEAANQALAQRAGELGTDEEIERLGRLHYQLVKPGEEAYVILPDGTPPTTSPPAPSPATPADPADAAEKGWLARAWDRITSIF